MVICSKGFRCSSNSRALRRARPDCTARACLDLDEAGRRDLWAVSHTARFDFFDLVIVALSIRNSQKSKVDPNAARGVDTEQSHIVNGTIRNFQRRQDVAMFRFVSSRSGHTRAVLFKSFNTFTQRPVRSSSAFHRGEYDDRLSQSLTLERGSIDYRGLDGYARDGNAQYTRSIRSGASGHRSVSTSINIRSWTSQLFVDARS